MSLADLMFEGPFRAILADPPWPFKVRSDKGKGRSPEAHYDTLSVADICALPVADLADKDCALFLWATGPMLPRAFEVMQAWGFAYKTVGFVWVKTKLGADVLEPASFPIGTGYWTRANPELCLLGTRGSPERSSKAVRTLLLAPRREHSRKPDEIHGEIEALVPGPYLELFSRESRLGWAAWGDQAGLFDGGHVETRRIPSEGRRPW